MQTNNNKPLKLSDTTRAIRLYQVDDEAIVKLREALGDMANVNIVDLIRDCIHAGAPLVLPRWEAMINEAKDQKK